MIITVKQIEDALRKNGGFVTRAAKTLGVSYQAIYKRMQKNKKLWDIKTEIEESYLDLAESKLLTKMDEGHFGSLCFYLKCKGKKRGYIENQQVNDNQDVKPQPVKIEFVAVDGRVIKNAS